MKKVVFIMILGLMSFPALGKRVQVYIHEIDVGTGEEAHLIKMSDGQVAFLRGPEKRELLEAIMENYRKEEKVEIQMDDRHNLLSIQTIEGEEKEIPEEEEWMSYDPTIVSSSSASTMFRNMRRNYQNNSQCYNRAHIWAYEEFNRTGIKSMKLFLFFTSRYIRNYNYHWWFHVTPMVYVDNSSNWKALDRRYTRGPLSIRAWTNVFMYNDAECPVVYKYSDYRDHQQSEHCYLIPTSMYFWQPRDILRQEQTGYEKTSFIKSEVNHAYWEAF